MINLHEKLITVERLIQFFTNDWAIQRHDLDSVVALLTPSIIAGNLKAADDLLQQKQPSIRAVAAPYLAHYWELDDINLPENAIAVVQLSGILLSWETDWLIRTIKAAEANPAICGIVMVIDGPGGHVTRVDVAADIIKKCTKPTATVVAGEMCSAHYWLGTCTDRVFALSNLCTVGSVGTMCEYIGMKKYFTNLGIDIRDIYPDTSDLKNEETRALERGDESLTKSRLEKVHQIFAETVAENLGITYDPTLELFRGRVFTADEAVAAGYIDQIASIEDAVTWVLTQATSRQAAQLYN